MELITIPEIAKRLGLESEAGRVRIWRLVNDKKLRPLTRTTSGTYLFDADNLPEIEQLVKTRKSA